MSSHESSSLRVDKSTYLYHVPAAAAAALPPPLHHLSTHAAVAMATVNRCARGAANQCAAPLPARSPARDAGRAAVPVPVLTAPIAALVARSHRC